MKSFSQYLTNRFQGKEVLIDLTSMKQIKGIITSVRASFLTLEDYKGNYAGVISLNHVCLVQEAKK